MGKQEVPKPLLAVLVVVLVAALYFFVLKGNDDGSQNVAAPAPQTAATGATSASDVTGATGASGATAGSTRQTSAERKRARHKKLVDAAAKAGVPLPLYEARKAGKIIIVFFYTPGGDVDKRVADSISAVEAGNKDIVTFKDSIANKSRYQGIAQAAQANTTPAIVLVYKKQAMLLQGYIDDVSLNQRVLQITK